MIDLSKAADKSSKAKKAMSPLSKAVSISSTIFKRAVQYYTVGDTPIGLDSRGCTISINSKVKISPSEY